MTEAGHRPALADAARQLLLLALAFPFLPLGDRAEFLLQIGFFTLVAGIMALSWDILARSGQVSLAHAAFYGLGAYGYALLLKAGLPWGLAMPLAALLAGVRQLAAGSGDHAPERHVLCDRHPGLYRGGADRDSEPAGSVAGGANGLLVPALLGGNPRGQYLLALALLGLTVGVSLAVRTYPAAPRLCRHPAG